MWTESTYLLDYGPRLVETQRVLQLLSHIIPQTDVQHLEHQTGEAHVLEALPEGHQMTALSVQLMEELQHGHLQQQTHVELQ